VPGGFPRVHDRQARQGTFYAASLQPGGSFNRCTTPVLLRPTWGAEEDDVFPALDEAEGVQAVDLLALKRGLEGEVEVGRGLHGRQARGAHGGHQPPIVAQRDLRAEEGLKGVRGLEVATATQASSGP